jgi:hypothetical protein
MAILAPGAKSSQYTVLKPFRVQRADGTGSRRLFKPGATVTLTDADGKEAIAGSYVEPAKFAEYSVLQPLLHNGEKLVKGDTVSLTEFQAKPLLARKTVVAKAPKPSLAKAAK